MDSRTSRFALTRGSSGSLFFDWFGLLEPLGWGGSGTEAEGEAGEEEAALGDVMMASPLLAGELTGAGGVRVTEDKDGTTEADTDRKCERFRTLEIFSIPLGALPDAARACAASLLLDRTSIRERDSNITTNEIE
jgi:hypothetical protein